MRLRESYGECYAAMTNKFPYMSRKTREGIIDVILAHRPDYPGTREEYRRWYKYNSDYRKAKREKYGSIWLMILMPLISAILRAIIERWLEKE